jgi:glycosyltransferase involved in cell wall biosynthesis
MRIAMVSQEYPPETAHGGIATQTFTKAHGLAALGHEVYVIAHSIDTRRHEYRTDAVEVIRIPGYDTHMQVNTDAARWITYSALVAAELGKLHRRVRVDVVDFPEWGCEAYVHLLNQTAWHRIPTVIHLQGPLVMLANTIGWPEPDSELHRVGLAMEACCLRLADGIVSSSRCSADWVAKRYGIDASKIPVIHAGIDTRVFRPGAAEQDDRPTLIFVGRVAYSKGVDTLVDAACVLAGEIPDLHVRLIGRVEKSVREELQRRALAAGHSSLLEFAGAVARTELPRELCRGHVFAAPSRYEGGPGFVYLEAMACGLPVIACAGSGAAEVVRDGETGMLVPPDDPSALTTVLRNLLHDAAHRERIGRAARAFAVAEADADACIRRYEHFLFSVVGANS